MLYNNILNLLFVIKNAEINIYVFWLDSMWGFTKIIIKDLCYKRLCFHFLFGFYKQTIF